MASEPRLPFDDQPSPADPMIARDEAARAFAVDPSRNVVLEASAGTGKTHVLVTRYINLLRAGVDPANILAITFTRKAAAEMRERIVRDLRAMAQLSAADETRWRALRDWLGDISISTIDAFCFALLREFPLEADLDPGFDIADETVMPRLIEDALDGALRAGRRMASKDPDIGLLMAMLGERRVRRGLEALLDRRLSAGPTIRRFLSAAAGPSPVEALARVVARMQDVLGSIDGGLEAFIADGPVGHDAYGLLAADLRAVAAGFGAETGAASSEADRKHTARAVLDRVSRYFLKDDGEPRARPPNGYLKKQCPTVAGWTRHSRAVAAAAPHVAEVISRFERDLNVALVRGTGRLFRIARGRYRQALDAQALVDFPEGLSRALHLLRQMDEFAQSRYRLEARYHHVLVDEFQDTNPSQWRLVARLVESWGEGMGLAHDGPLQPSIFIVGDRKQSIYAFRDADVRMLRRARRYIAALRPDGKVRRSIARSFRAAPELLAFTNDLFSSIDSSVKRADAFRFTARDRFPVGTSSPASGRLGLIAAGDTLAAADIIAAEIGRLLSEGVVRDRQSGLSRPARPGDIAILFRSRESHREIEAALEARGIPTYVYKGLGFFDADEVKDLVALLRYLGQPASPLRAAALLRSRFVRVSDRAVRLLTPHAENVLFGLEPPPAGLSEEDRRVLDRLRASLDAWLPLVDRVPPAEVLDRVIADAAYAFELRSPRFVQARENLKKVRAMTRRLQNRGYATMARVADHVDRLSAGDESNAAVDALDAVNLMTVHAAKGLEFPFVFVTHLTRGTGGRGDPIVIVPAGQGGRPLVSIGGSLPEAEEAVRQRDREETKRLFYVAVTRAREKLYLAAVLKQGRFQATTGSLGEVLPASLREAFAQAARGGASVEWRAENGGVHTFGIAGADAGGAGTASSDADGHAGAMASPAPPADFAPLSDAIGDRRVGAAAYAMSMASGDRDDTSDATLTQPVGPDPALVGTVVHRLFQASQGTTDPDESWLADRARTFIAGREDGVESDPADVVAAAVDAFLRLRRRPDVSSVMDGATCHYELPFSLRIQPSDGTGTLREATVVRGSIDCLAQRRDGTVTVLELKTGRRQPWHDVQLAVYVRAARSLFPGLSVEGRLIYSDLPEIVAEP
ncbi:MAG TPA: UvrD-helicase domain-containing protein [Vicinamibacterales bacterium]